MKTKPQGEQMALTEGDKAVCRQIAREIVQEVLKEHILSCPHGRALLASRMLLVGISLGSGLAGGSTVWALINLVRGG